MNFVTKKNLVSAYLLLGCLVPSVASADITVGGDRPATVHVPPSYDPDVPTPLVLVLHGVCGECVAPDGSIIFNYVDFVFRFKELADVRDFLVIEPEGTIRDDLSLFWNATDACCDTFGSGVDDSGYLRGLIDETKSLLSVDDRRVYAFGHSNGGFMTHRLACDHADAIAGIASFAGATYSDPEQCASTGPVHVLEIRGTNDDRVPYEGATSSMGPFPGAIETVEFWADRNGCTLDWTVPEEELDLAVMTGAEVKVRRYQSGCVSGGSADLWTLINEVHRPQFNPEGDSTIFASRIVDWLFAHPKSPVPVASFSMTDGGDSRSRDFDAGGSTTPAGTTITAYEWDFGDGGIADGLFATHTYERPGLYTVILTIRTTDGGRVVQARERIMIPLIPNDVTPWTSVDIGDTGEAGLARFEGEDLLLFSGGKSFAGLADNFHFVQQEFVGDTVVTARIRSLSPVDATSSVGLTLRGGLEQNARHATILLARTGSSQHMEFVNRRTLLTRRTSSEDLPDTWVRIERLGDEFIGYHSPNGILWTELGRQTITMPEVILGGVAVTAINTAGNEVVLAEIANLYIGDPPDPRYIRGDGNGDGRVNLADPSFIAGTIFGLSVAPITCEAAADANGDGAVNIADPTYIANFLFGIGPAPAPPAPFPDCALVPPEEPLSCLGTEGCLE